MDTREREKTYQFWLNALKESGETRPPVPLQRHNNEIFICYIKKNIPYLIEITRKNKMCLLSTELIDVPVTIEEIDSRTGYIALSIPAYANKKIRQSTFFSIHTYSTSFLNNLQLLLERYQKERTACMNSLLDVLANKHEALMEAGDGSLVFIWGPPGTGKTSKLASLALQANGRVLAVASTNHAADNIYYTIANQDSSATKHMLRTGIQNRSSIKTTISTEHARTKAKITITTIAQVILHFDVFKNELGSFNIVLIDEAGTVKAPELIMLSLLGERMVIAGDHKQLTTIETEDNICLRSIYDIIEMNTLQLPGKGKIEYLKEQHRMPSDIASFISREFYDNALETKDSERKRLKKPDDEKLCKALTALLRIFPSGLNALDTSQFSLAARKTKDGSRMSFMNALLSVLTAMLWNDTTGCDVGIITPYNAEAELMNKLLQILDRNDERITADTIHRFQGQARDIIILDLTDSYPLDPGSLFSAGFEQDNEKKLQRIADMRRLINVAVSRTSFKFILLGDIKGFIDDIEQNRWKYTGQADEIPVLGKLLKECSKSSLPTERKKRKALSEVLYHSTVLYSEKLSIGAPGCSRNQRSDMTSAWMMRHQLRELLDQENTALTYYMSTMEWKTELEDTAFSDKIISMLQEGKVKLTVVYQLGAFRTHGRWNELIERKREKRTLPELPFATIKQGKVFIAVYGLFHSGNVIREGSTYGCVIFHDGRKFLKAFNVKNRHGKSLNSTSKDV